MRITTTISCLASLFLAELSNAAASVYLRPSTANLGQLSAPQADVLLANHLGLESTASLDSDDLESLLESAGGQANLGKALLDSQEDSLLVVLDVDEADLPQIIPDTWSSPTFSSSFTASSLSALVESYSNAASRTDFVVYSDAEPQDSRAPKRFLDIFDFAGDSEAIGTFVKSFDALVEFIERTDPSARRFGVYHLSNLAAVAEEYGPSSDAYQGILLALKATLSNPALQSANVAVVLSSTADKTRRDAKAPESTQAPFPLPPPGNSPIFSSSTCYSTAAKCTDGTTNCSGHGQCVSVKKGPRECFVCQCAVTQDTKNRTEYWSGSSCQTKDVSVAFTLVTGTTVGIVLVIIFAISLLYSVGSEELPNVLTGGIVHVKRD